MIEYERTITIDASADEVFHLVSSVSNLPKFVAAIQDAELESPGRVRVRGVIGGREFDSGGYVRIDNAQRRMDWGSDGDPQYRGWLEVKAGDATPNICELTVRLLLEPHFEFGEEQGAAFDEANQAQLWETLTRIRDLAHEFQRVGPR